ncbi:hypothetical protein TNIN_96641 [Trichonephila inaurata madagascariensis]|uniref:Uncharacterized protein n=1 Tax=Trichonephila inaurata madagascariensis TaxID=2747483 RepID=A0A8X6XPT4_9ARAC|nr:hypothetical protein TNIN_96641 [Trichonephila inaurata madagascariensis]
MLLLIFLRCEVKIQRPVNLYRQDAEGSCSMKSLSIRDWNSLYMSQYQARLSQSVSSDMKLENVPKIFGQTRQMLYIGSKTETWARALT